jgi:hypothetical protein
VTAVVDETPRVRSLELEVPGWPGHLAGQHVDVRLTAAELFALVVGVVLTSWGARAEAQAKLQLTPGGLAVVVAPETARSLERDRALAGHLHPDGRRQLAWWCLSLRRRDFVVETAGRPEMAALAAKVLAPLGAAELIGMPNPGVTIPHDPLPRMVGRSSGALPLDRLVRFHDLDHID